MNNLDLRNTNLYEKIAENYFNAVWQLLTAVINLPFDYEFSQLFRLTLAHLRYSSTNLRLFFLVFLNLYFVRYLLVSVPRIHNEFPFQQCTKIDKSASVAKF